AQQLGVNSQAAITAFQDIQKSGELIRPESVNRQAQDFVNDIYRVASDPNASAQDIGRAIASAALKYPAGAAAHLGVELIQELPQLLLPGGPVAQFMGSIALNAAESAGAQALQKIDELKAANPNLTAQELARLARSDAAIAGAVTTAISFIPGANTAIGRTLLETGTEALEEGLIEYLTSGDVNAAKGKAVLGAVIGGKTAAAINTGEQVAEAAQNQFGVSPIFTGSAPIATTPSASVTVTGTRLPSDLLGGGGVDITPSNLGTLPTAAAPLVDFQIAASPAEAVQLATSTGGNAAVVISVNPSTNTSIVMQSNGKTSVLPTSQLTNGSLVVLPATVTAAPTGGLTGDAGTIASAATAPGFTGAVQPITTGAAAPTGGITGQALIDAALAANANLTSGIVLNNNNDGTSTILKTDGSVSVVPTLDTQTGSNLTTGTQVLVDTVNNTATDVATQIGTQTQTWIKY
ncbi:MAG: hypothetical protein EBR30_21955, partial [Cytophagia bacterium]|nr:hypothetical protein [Cytophagia bacterium]